MKPATGTIEVRKEDLGRLGVATLLASEAGGAAASLRRKGATKVPYCTECQNHIKWARMGGWFGFGLNTLVVGFFGLLGGGFVYGVTNVLMVEWVVQHPTAAPYLLCGGGTAIGLGIGLANLRWRPQPGPASRHVRQKDAVEIAGLGKDQITLKCHNNAFADEVIKVNPGAAYSRIT